MTKSFPPPQNSRLHYFELKLFVWQLGPNWGAYFFLFWKISVSYVRRSKILRTLSKTLNFGILRILWNLPNFIETRFQRKKKNTHPNLVEVVVEKFSARSAKPFWRKRGKTCFWHQKSDFEKYAKLWKIMKIFFSFFHLQFFFVLKQCRLCLLAHTKNCFRAIFG